jgi:hypothetical protein
MSCICKKLTGKFLSLFFLFFLTLSCNSSKKIIIEKKNKADIVKYYEQNNIQDVLFLKNFDNYKKLDSINFTTIPDIFIFNSKGNLIKFRENDKNECINEPILFIENIKNKKIEFDSTINLDKYSSLFVANYNFESYLKNENKIEYFVFINTATFTDRLNQIRFIDSKKMENKTTKIFFINLDLIDDWF